MVLRVERGFSRFSWSPSGQWLRIRVSQDDEGEFLLLNVDSGETRSIPQGAYEFALWDREEDSFVYGTSEAIYSASVDGEVQRLVEAGPEGCSWCGWQWTFGQSPDGRYYGLFDDSVYDPELDVWGGGRIGVLDLTTGEMLTLVEEEDEDILFLDVQWWR